MADNPSLDRPVPPPAASHILAELGYPVAVGTLAQKRVHGGGPQFLKFGRRVLYKPSDLRAWIAETARIQSNTGQAA